MKLSGWGRFPAHETRLVVPQDENTLADAVRAGGIIARGNGRAYGDSAIGASITLDMRPFDRFVAFDPVSGILEAEAGVLLADIVRTFLPRGWFPTVTPGTKFVTLGGMIAADVHGKNHHRDGGMRACVAWIDLMGPDGVVRRCAPDQDPELFAWTLGGMGLTGVIVRAGVRLKPVETGWIAQTTLAAPDLSAVMAIFEAHAEAPYSVAWIDGLGRGKNLGRSLVMLGAHVPLAGLTADKVADRFAMQSRPVFSVPLTLPTRVLNRWTVGAFNAAYYRLGVRRVGTAIVGWDPFFYPLDRLLHWNRIYGRGGLMQFQCVLPLAAAEAGLRALLTTVARAGSASFLTVLKRFGPGEGPISFPMEGYTLALDFPVTSRTLSLMTTLDRITARHGGRFYLAKDSRMSMQTLSESDARFDAFRRMRTENGLATAFQSAQSRRLNI